MQTKRWPQQWLTILSWAVPLLWGSWLRFGYPGLNPFGFDEARVSHMALQMARGGQFAALGMQSSTGVPNFPAMVWLMALPYRLTTDPLWATRFIAAINVAAIGLFWWLVARAWGKTAAFAAALLLAVSPYAVFYSRSIWAQNLLIPGTIAWAATAVLAVTSPRKPQLWLALHIFLAGFVLQLHLAAVPLIVGSGWLLLRYRLWRRWPAILAGGLAALAAAAPYAYIIWCCGAGARADWQRVLSGTAVFNRTLPTELRDLATGLAWEKLLLGNVTAPTAWQWGTAVLLLLAMAAGLIHMVLQRRRREKVEHRTAVLLTLLPVWLLATPLYFLRFQTVIGTHHLLTILPALFLLIALIIASRPGRGWQIGSVLLLLAVGTVQSRSFSQHLTAWAHSSRPGDIGTPLRYTRAAAAALQDGQPIVLHSFGDNAAFDGDAAMFAVLLWDYPHQIVDGRSVLLLPGTAAASTAVHLLFTYDYLPAHTILNRLAVGNSASLPRRQNELPYLYTDIPANVSLPIATVPKVRLVNGATLIGWQAMPLGAAQWRLVTTWYIEEAVQPAAYQQFNHIWTADSSEPIAILDTGLSGSRWQAENILISWVDFDSSPYAGPFWVDLGMYTWPDITRTPRLDHEGDPLAPIRVGPFG